LAAVIPHEASVDSGSRQGSGFGEANGNGAANGSEGSGSGSGSDGGSGGGGDLISPPVRIAGELTSEDYRRANPPRGAGGLVVVSFRVRTDGRTDDCEVLRSSGFEIFDTTTCRLIEERFLYRPARDASGREAEWEVRTNYQWIPR
jgi:protein TonB